MESRAHHATRARLSDKGRLVIPAAMREALGIGPGTEVEIRMVDDELRIVTMRSRLKRAQKWVKSVVESGVSLADELSEERREAAKHE